MAGLKSNNNKIKTVHLYKIRASRCLAGALLPGQSSQQRNRPAAARVTILPAVSWWCLSA
jgi:hypothetical protein